MTNRDEILRLCPDTLFDEPMSRHTSFRIGGCADVFASPADENQLRALINYCRECGTEFMIMGNGSNMLVSDKGIRGAVIRIGANMSSYEIDGESVYAQAGILMSALANALLKAELTGFEELSGIPGTVGGGIYMNAGAYGGEMKNVIESVTYMDENGDIVTAQRDELDFGYRHSIFSDKSSVILSCTMKLKKGSADEIRAAMREYTRRRTEKQPLSVPSAGSVFKRPKGYFAGKLIQDCGLMGFRIGGAQVSEKHAGFIVNVKDATAKDVLDVIAHVRAEVKERFGVELEPEIRPVGEM